MFASKLISFSNDGTRLVICNSNGNLKIWDTASNILEKEFHPGKFLSSSITCLEFSPEVKRNTFKYEKKKKKRNSLDSSGTSVAMGTLDGSVLIYNLNKETVTDKLIHANSSSVTDISWHSPHTVASLGEDKKLILWNFKEKLYILEVNGTKSLCCLGCNTFAVGSTNIEILKYDRKTKYTESHITSAHKTFIAQMVPVTLAEENQARYILTAAENDRFVYAWSAESNSQGPPVGAFMVEDIVRTISCFEMEDMTFGIGVTTKKGHLCFYLHHFNGVQPQTPVVRKGVLKIKTEGENSKILPILNSHFISSEVLLITYGSDLFPHCERVSVDALVGAVRWNRKDPSLFRKSKETSLHKTITPHVPEEAVHLMPTQVTPLEMKEVPTKRKREGETTELPMEERLEALAITQPLARIPDGRPLDNYVHLLIQALHSKDTTLMNSILSKGEDEEIINNTVRRLPVSHVVPFVQYLQEVMCSKGLKNTCCINWIKCILYHHTSHLSSVPNKKSLLEPLYAMFAARTSSLIAVAKLQARISLLLTHVKNRHENITQNKSDSTSEALLRLKEDSSDEEDLREMGAGPSESEDMWDDWNEEDGGEEEEEEELSEKRNGPVRAAKRKLNSKEDFISLSEDDDCVEELEQVQSVSESD